MSNIEVSQADLLRTWIEKKLDEKYDYSKPSFKKNDIKEFVKNNPELNTTESKVAKHFPGILKEVADRRGISYSEIGIKESKRSPSVVNNQSDMNMTVTPVFQPEIIPYDPQNGPQIPRQPGIHSTPYVNPNITSQTGSSFVQGGLSGLKILLPTLELLNDEEKKIVGEALMPPLSRIQDERITLYVLPFITVAGVVGPKIGKAVKERKKTKQEKLKKQKEEQDEKQLKEE